MSKQFPVFPLPEVLLFQEGPGILAVDFHEEGVPLIRISGLRKQSDLTFGCNYLDPEKVEKKWSHFRTNLGDTLLSTSASLGEIAVVREKDVGLIPYTGIVRFWPKNELVDPKFIKWMLKDPRFSDQIQAMGSGSVMKHFGPMHLKKMTVQVPRLETQKLISGLLGALDDKVEANTKLAHTADELASALYLQAIQTNPVEVPLSSLARFVNGKAFTKNATGHGRVVIRIAEMNSGIGASTVRNDLEVAEDNTAYPGDILFAWSGSLTAMRWQLAEGIINQHIFKVIPTEPRPDWLVYQALQQKLSTFKAIAADKATTMGHIQRKHLDEPVLIPNEIEMLGLNTKVKALWDKAFCAQQENQKLAELRDYLLPRLMSGKITVREAEELIN